jgi:alkanesulfonate monooxygenase SsuD/methylene tetrahydromethanopterin reductase-like flavin-dependent oxidoreductase (luciferase family)
LERFYEDRIVNCRLGQGGASAHAPHDHAERLGFGTLWAPEHVVLFDRYTESKYPYSQDGAFAAPSTIDWMDPFVALTYVAARTSKIRLATGICLVPEHIRWCWRK